MPEVTINSADGGRFAAYLSLPSTGGAKVPGIIMMHHMFGVNPEMRGFTDDFAAHGYVAVCPDLFWRQQPGFEIVPGTPEADQKALPIVLGFNTDTGIDDLKATLAFLRAHPLCGGRVGTVGYCVGGRLAFLMAARSDADCNVSYFGTGMERWIAEAVSVARPLMLHIPEKDRHVSPEAQAIVKSGLAGRAEIFSYPNADHAFNRVGAATYDSAVTALAYDRTATFLRRHLGARA